MRTSSKFIVPALGHCKYQAPSSTSLHRKKKSNPEKSIVFRDGLSCSGYTARRPEYTLSGKSHHRDLKLHPVLTQVFSLASGDRNRYRTMTPFPDQLPTSKRCKFLREKGKLSQHLSYMICSNVLYFVQIAVVTCKTVSKQEVSPERFSQWDWAYS